jgi:hypothetical protein
MARLATDAQTRRREGPDERGGRFIAGRTSDPDFLRRGVDRRPIVAMVEDARLDSVATEVDREERLPDPSKRGAGRSGIASTSARTSLSTRSSERVPLRFARSSEPSDFVEVHDRGAKAERMQRRDDGVLHHFWWRGGGVHERHNKRVAPPFICGRFQPIAGERAVRLHSLEHEIDRALARRFRRVERLIAIRGDEAGRFEERIAIAKRHRHTSENSTIDRLGADR